MNSKTILIILILLLLTISAFLLKTTLTGNLIKDIKTYTTAICNESNLCQDYVIKCQDKEVIEKTPITGAVIQKSADWQDPRQDKELCD